MPDPLQLLPAEIVLRCVEFMPVSSVAVALNCTSKPWHNFLDTTHQDTIYSHQAHKLYNKHPRRDREVTLLHRDYNAIAHADKSFVHYFRHVHSWKDFCRRLLLLEKNWNSERPVTRESIVQVGYDPIWRFKTDFNRRFFISTSQSGGVCVTDMDTGRMLWRLTREHVRMCAHLEYDQESGIACWDRMGNAIEVWKADDHGQERGVFNRIATLNHDCETRGFQLSRFNNKPTLCVVSSEAKGFVWDLSTDPPQQTRILDIDNEAVGHLDQGEDTVMYSMGQRGYHVCSKTTGETLGKFDPKDCRNIYHITHPPPEYDSTWKTREHGPTTHVCPPQNPRNDRLTPLKLYNGPHPEPGIDMAIEDDEWGSGIISGNHMAGVSRGGRVFICTDFLGALADPKRFQQTTAILHTEGDGSTFELGGWLSIKNGRVIFEIIDHVYIFTLPDEGGIPEVGSELQRPIWATPIASAIQLAVPVSFMAIYDDSIMYTYTTLGYRHARDANDTNNNNALITERTRAFPTKAIRILSLAPDLSQPLGHELSYQQDPPRTAESCRQAAMEGADRLEAMIAQLEEDDMTDMMDMDDEGVPRTAYYAPSLDDFDFDFDDDDDDAHEDYGHDSERSDQDEHVQEEA